MTIKPVCSFSARGVKVTLAVAVNSGAGNFCSKRLGTSQKFLNAAGGATLKRRMKPNDPAGRAQFVPGFACHCHCRPISFALKSSESAGVNGAHSRPTFGLRYD